MQISDMPKYRAHLSRHGHNLNHKFDFTSSTGHLLTVFSQIMNPKETISGYIDLFSRTQPLNSPSHVEINTYIDYFFVPLDMLYSGFGDSLYQTNEPYSSMIQVSSNDLPVFLFETLPDNLYDDVLNGEGDTLHLDFSFVDSYSCDSLWFSIYRNLFHNACNPNYLFKTTAIPLTFVQPLDSYQPNVLPLSLMAYNCVYENFYRLDEREKFDNSIYNIDGYLYDGEGLFSDNQMKFASLKYRPLAFDYFTSAKVAPLINTLNVNTTNNQNSSLLAVNNYLTNLGIFGQKKDDVLFNNGESYIDQNTTAFKSSRTYNESTLNTAGIRSMFAVEKIISVTGRAKKTYDAQVMAHLGVPVPRDIKHEITYVGTQRGVIKIGEIIATAGTSDTPLGDMAGKGYGQMNNKGIDFTAPCHGIFIGIYSAVPRISYYSPLEKHMQISSRLDFFHPEFEKLGMQPIFGYECTPYNTTNAASIAGWQMRYQQYKQRFDKVSPAFIEHEVHDSWYPSQSHAYNQWSNWVLASRPYRKFMTSSASVYTANFSNFLSQPTDLNNIMSIKYGWHLISDADLDGYNYFDNTSVPTAERKSFASNPASLFYRDPLIHFGEIKFKLVSEMSDNTLPDLNI